ncbi:MAG: adenylate/guanylate cyclase domain-containing protein [Candidatus Promineifilaceae bacterium]|nr:adenylate/guanylate cyclase domain-containing protein [Candidatus Promineifilaceae bacterium]
MKFIGRIERRIVLPGDSETLRSQKVLSLILMFVGSLFTFVNVTTYLLLGSPATSLIYLGLIVFVSGAGLLSLAFPLKWRAISYAVIFGIIIFNMAAHVSAGGFQSGLEAVIWMTLGPIAAAMFLSPRFTVIATVFYALCILVAALLEPFAQSIAPSMPLPSRMRIASSNMILMGIFITASSLYLLRQVDFYRHRTEELLQNMLPAPIAARLKISSETIAEAYQEVTVLFADMVGSTPLFAQLEPAAAVDWLNEVFLMFDDLVDKFGLEKIRTIGDNYMVAAGVPLPRAGHACAMTDFALEMQRAVQNIRPLAGKKMAFRVGIHTGPLVAGVIGRTKYQYDLWGDTVNIASRMESHSEAGKVHISAATYALIKDSFNCAGRGHIPVKGKGEMETWFVLGRKS